jgi:hypothetical protein
VTRNGYRLCPSSDSVRALWELLEAFKERARPLLREALCREMAQACARVLDNRALDLPRSAAGVAYEARDTPYEVAYRVVLRRHQANYEACRYEFDAHVSVLPVSETLALLHTENAAAREAWEATPGVEPFPCWSDEKGATAGEWAVRSAFWEEALDRSPSVAGFRTECFGQFGLPVPEPEEVALYIPERRERALLLATERVLGRWLRRQPPPSDRAVPLLVLEGIQWVRSDREGHAQVEGERDEIAPQLPLIDVPMVSA